MDELADFMKFSFRSQLSLSANINIGYIDFRINLMTFHNQLRDLFKNEDKYRYAINMYKVKQQQKKEGPHDKG